MKNWLQVKNGYAPAGWQSGASSTVEDEKEKKEHYRRRPKDLRPESGNEDHRVLLTRPSQCAIAFRSVWANSAPPVAVLNETLKIF